MRTGVPGVASAASFGAWVPMERSTAPFGGIGVPPPVACAVTVPTSSPPLVAGGKSSNTASVEPATTGVFVPQAGVYSVEPSPIGVRFTDTVRLLPSPCQ